MQTQHPITKINAQHAKRGKADRASTEAKFRKAIERFIADLKAYDAEAFYGLLDTFKRVEVMDELEGAYGGTTGLSMMFDGSPAFALFTGCNPSSESNQFYRGGLQALCELHGWRFEDFTSWSISFHRA